TGGQAGIKSSAGIITVPTQFTGVSLVELAKLAGGLTPDFSLNIVAKDGYFMTISYNQIINGEFIAYDPATGDERQMDEPLTMILAYENQGQPISAETDGPLRLAIISSKNNQVTDGHWSVKWVTRIELKPVGAEWGLDLHGAIDDTIDRNSFQSCSAPGCHAASWTDDKGQEWAGTPLFYFAGRVDDAIKHDGPAFWDLLGSLGYDVQLVAGDGYSITLPIARLAHNRDVLLAYMVDDGPLPEKYFPLRLVGPGLDGKEMIGSVVRINLLIDPAVLQKANEIMPPASPTPPAATEAAPTAAAEQPPAPPVSVPPAELIITGQVAKPLGFMHADLLAMPVVKIEAEHPKKGKQSYEGVLINDLLALAQPAAGAKTVLFSAADGYTVEAALSELLACTGCLLAFDEAPGSYLLVMPGFPSSLWTRDVVAIEIK
ncbi:MAG: molybdopterin-dependent oxidoreductase, partial [Chloroflexota bacterium]